MKNIIKVITLCPAILQAGQFIGKESIGNTSYLNNRYLNHNLGRFLNQDVLQEYNGHYSYQKGDVVLFSDPTGLGATDDEGGISGEVIQIVDELWGDEPKSATPPKENVTKEEDKTVAADTKDTNSVIDPNSGASHGRGDFSNRVNPFNKTSGSHVDLDISSFSSNESEDIYKAVPNLQEPEENVPDESYKSKRKRKTKKKGRQKISPEDNLNGYASEQSDLEQSDIERGRTHLKESIRKSYQNDQDRLSESAIRPGYDSSADTDKLIAREKYTDKIAIGIFAGVVVFTLVGTFTGLHFMGAF